MIEKEEEDARRKKEVRALERKALALNFVMLSNACVSPLSACIPYDVLELVTAS